MLIRPGIHMRLVCVAGLVLGGEPELLYEGKNMRLTQYLAKHKEEVIYLPVETPREEILRRVKEVSNRNIRIELGYDASKEGQPFLRLTYIGGLPEFNVAVLLGATSGMVVLFAREVPPDVLAEYELRRNIVDCPAGTTLDELREKFSKIAEKSSKLLKVEVGRDPTRDNRYFTRQTYLGENRKEKAAKARWCEWAKKELSCSKSTKSFKAKGCEASFDVAVTFFAGERVHYGFVTDSYTGPDGERVSVTIYEIQERDVDGHAFLRRLVREELALQRTPSGYVVRREDKWGKTTAQWQRRGYAWASGKRRALSITSLGAWPDELLAQYLQKYPSTLTEKTVIDKEAWGKQEVEDLLQRLGKLLSSGEGTWKPYGDFSKLANPLVVTLPAGRLSQRLSRSQRWAEAKENYDAVVKWWESNKTKVRWDEKMQCLMAE